MSNACCVWDFTLSCEKTDNEVIKKWLKENCKKYAYQREEGNKTGYKHFQGRISLKLKKRKSELLKYISNTCMEKASFSPTSNLNKDNDFYVLKEETRIEGPWTDKDEEIYIPRQVREIESLYPWQKHIVDNANVWDTRHINIIYDSTGNIGKSTLVTYIRCHKIGRKIPPLNDYRDMMRIVCDMPTSRLYIIDMPKAMKKDKLGQMYTAIEEIKGGYAFDDRYSFREKIFDCPNIWVFANQLPDIELLSKDRWHIWIIEDGNLRRQSL